MINNKRQQKVLEILIENKRVLTGEEICMAVGVSSRTVRSDVKELNSIIEDYGVHILSEKGKGYSLKISSIDVFNDFIKKINGDKKSINLTSEERVEYILYKLLVNEMVGTSGITLNDLADELYISTSSLKNDLKLLKEKLHAVGVDINKISNKGIGIAGDEEKIRDVINRYLIHNGGKFIKEFREIFFKECNARDEEIYHMVMTVVKKHNLLLTDTAYKVILNHLLILIVRNKYGHFIDYDRDTLIDLKNKKGWEISKDICNNIESILKISLREEEYGYITKYIISSSTLSKGENEEDNNIEEFLNYILEEINEKLGIDVRSDKVLDDFLSMHLKASLNRAKYGIIIENSMLSTIKSNYPFAFEIGIFSNEIIKREKGISLSEEDIGFLALHFEASLERNKCSKDRKRAIVVCTTGLGTSLLIKIKLESHFRNRLIVEDTIPWYEFNEELLNKYDLIISTVPLNNHSDKVINIKNLLDKKEINLIEDRIDGTGECRNSLTASFMESLYIKNLSGDGSTDIIQKMGNKLISQGLISKGVLDEILKRELLASTEIGNLVAIPHIMSEAIDKSFIMVGILNKSVLWDKEQVQLVLLIGMAEKDKHLWKGNLEKIYRSIIDLDVVLSIIKTENYKDFIDTIGKF
ncbi:MAG: BglG family transcription antiterminator [Clostridium sp.]